MVIFAALKNRILHTVNDNVRDLYGGHVRVRACGICIADDQILLVNHAMYGENGFFWSPPGGGVMFGETARKTVIREFKEEANIDVKVGKLLFVNEHIAGPLHAVELFFEINSFEGLISKGIDPEFSADDQIIKDVRWMNWEEIKKYKAEQLHSLFSLADSIGGIRGLDNYITKK
jgi:8-oxo-dGTP diphosphatase